jgi:hypothetical protein
MMKRLLVCALTLIWGIPLAAGAQEANPTVPMVSPAPSMDPGVGGPVPIAVINPFVYKVSAYRFKTCFDFRNVAAKPIKAIRFGFSYTDAFGGVTGGVYGDRTGSFAPGVLIAGPSQHPNAFQINSDAYENCWVTDTGFTSVNSLSVFVLQALFADGTMWANPTPNVAAAQGTFVP